MAHSLLFRFVCLTAVGLCLLASAGCEGQANVGKKIRSAASLPSIEDVRIESQRMTRADLVKWLGKPDYEEEHSDSTVLFYDKVAKNPETGEVKNAQFTIRDEIVQKVEFP